MSEILKKKQNTILCNEYNNSENVSTKYSYNTLTISLENGIFSSQKHWNRVVGNACFKTLPLLLSCPLSSRLNRV